MKIKRGSQEFLVREFGPEALDGEFYRLSGRFFASGPVRTEVGAALTVTPGDWWFVLLEREVAIGLCGCSINKAGNLVTIKYLYVIKEKRSQLSEPFLNKLLGFLDKKFSTTAMQTTCHESGVGLYARHGFVEQSRRGQYVKLTRQGGDVS